jgi:hypothetical protein
MLKTLSLFVRLSLCGLFLLGLAVTANAQFKAGIQGTVKDSSGALIPGATITLTNAETGKIQDTTSSDDGYYRISGLAPGKYKIKVEKAGYKLSTIDNVAVSAEGIQGIDIAMEPGEVSATVTVDPNDVAVLRTEDGNVDRALTTQEIRQLPQNGRSPYELLRLTPGVFGDGARGGNGGAVNLPNTTGPGGSNNSIFQTENQVPISANGQRLSSNNFMIDGVSVNSYNWGGAAIVTPNQEAVKEIRVLSSSYSAEDGRNSGAQIKVVSQNGTNDVHGSAFFKYNSPKLNAFNKFGGSNAPPVRVNDYIRQFGGSLGGPLPFPHFGEGGPTTVWGRNKSFFFVSYEGLRNSVTNTGRAYVETPEYRQLIQQVRPNSVTARVLSASGITPRILNVLTPSCSAFGNDPTRCRVVAGGLDIGSPTGATGQYVSLGNPVGGGFDNIPDIQEVQFALPGRNQGNQYNVRLDFTPNSNDSFTISTFLTRLNNIGSDAGSQGRPIGDLPFKPFNSSGTILYTHIFSPTMLNEARFNVSRFFIDQVADVEAAGTNLGIPRVEVEGLPIGDRIRFGAPQGEGTPGTFAQNTFEFSDTLSKTFGNHGFRFGVIVRKEQDNSDLSVGGARPVYSFSGLWNLANDAPIFEGINADPRTGAPATGHPYFRNSYFAGYVQDDWKARPNLTLNLGLRYEYYSPVTEKFGRLTNVFFTPGNLSTIEVRPVDRLSNPDRNNFAPRFGFAYTPGGLRIGNLFDGGRAVIRGGAGVAYNRIPVAPLNNVRGNPPFFARFGLCCGTAPTDFGTPFAGGTILYATGTSNSIGSYPRNPALGQGVRPNGSVIAGPVELWGTPQDLPNAFVYTYSLEMQYELFANLVATAGYQGSSGHKLIRLVNQNFLFTNNPNFFQIFFSTPDVNSNYNALNLNLTRRFTRGLALQGNYRWSKSIDQLSYEGPGFVTNQTFPQDNSTERGPSDFDARHYFNATALYELPFFKGRNDLAERVLGGFQITGIVTYHTGFPFTPTSGTCTSTPGGPSVCPARPQGYSGPSDLPSSNDAFKTGIFGPNGASFFPRIANAPPGIGRNSFRGPRYFSTDMSLVKQIALSKIRPLGEAANLEIRANFFNVFNQLNLAPFAFGSPSVSITDPNFGRATTGLAGRVVELQGRLRF